MAEQMPPSFRRYPPSFRPMNAAPRPTPTPAPEPVEPASGVQDALARLGAGRSMLGTASDLVLSDEQQAAVERAAGQFGSGVNRGMAQGAGLLGMPTDAATGLATMAGFPPDPNPNMGSRWITEKVAGLMPEPLQPETPVQRYADRIGEEFGASVPGAAVGLMARGAALAGKIARPTLQSIGEALLKVSPEKLAATEAALATSAGAGAAFAREKFPDSPTAELVGQLVGGVGAPVAYDIVRGLANKARRAAHFMTDDEVAAQVADIIDRNVPPGALAEGLAERDAIRLDIPAFSPTSAQVTNSPGLAALERARASAPGDFAPRLESIQDDAQEAFRDLFARIPGVPKGTAGAADVQDALDRLLTERIALASAAAKDAVRVAPSLSPDDAGRVLRAELNKAEADFRLAADTLFDQVDRGNTIQLPLENVGRTALRQLRDRPALDAAEDVPKATVELKRLVDTHVRDQAKGRAAQFGYEADDEVIDALTDDALSGVTISFKDLRAVRSRVLRDLRNERAAPLDKRRDVKIARLAELLASVEETLDGVALRTDAPEVAEAYRRANAFYKDGVRRFRSGAAAAVRDLDSTGRTKIPDNMAGGAFFKSGPLGQRAGEDFNAAMVRLQETPDGQRWVASPEGREALRAYALQTLAETGDTEGRLSLGGIQKWRAKHQSALKTFPELDAETQSLEKAQRALEERALVLKRSAAEVETSALKRVMGADPDKAVSVLLAGKKPAREVAKLRQLIGDDEEAMRGLRRAVLDHIEAGATTGKRTLRQEIPFLSPYKLRGMREQFGGVIDQLYSDEERRQLAVVQRAADILARSERSRVSGSDTKQKLAYGQSAVQLFENLWGGGTGASLAKMGLRAAKRRLLGINDAKVERLLQDALIDPDALDILYRHVRGAKLETTIRRLNVHLANRVPAAAQTLDDMIPDPSEVDEVGPPTPKPTLRPGVRFTAQAPPAPPPKVPKPAKPVDVTKDLARGKITTNDLAELARSASNARN